MYVRCITAILSVSALLGASVASAAASGPAWASTATQAIPLANATDQGPDASSTPVEISVALALRNQPQLQSYIAAVSKPGSPEFGQSLTPSEFTAQFGPTNNQVQAVESYLTSQGFQDVSASTNNIYVSGWATPSQAATAFNTKIDNFTQNKSVVYANTQPASVPSSLSGIAVSVLGLTDALKMQMPLAQTPSTNVPNSFWAPGFQKAYDATGTAPASNVAIAIMAEGDVSSVVSDLRDYEQDPNNATCTTTGGTKTCTSLPQVPVSVVHTGPASSDTSGQVEFDMDTQTSTGIAGNVARLYIYDATSLTDSDVALEFNTWASQDVAKAASASFGECEYAAYLDGFMVADDETLSEAAAQGQTLFASSGDSGGFCAANGLTNGVPVGEPDVNYPASSPYTVAAGGTTLVTNTDGSYGESLAWDASGGGPSYFEYQPAWQSGVAPPTGDSCEVQLPACLARDVPDVGMDADFLLSAANFYDSGATTSNGGTSLASPLSLGSWARIESNLTNEVGFASPSLYAAAGSTGFNEVTLGDCGPYPATPGWNFCDGNGSFDIANMIGVLGKQQVQQTFPPVPAPTCNEFTGNGTANPLGSTGNNDALSIESGGLGSNRTAKTISAVIRVKSLTDGPGGLPAVSGTGDEWYFEFDWQPTPTSTATTYFVSATYDPSTVVNNQSATGFSYGYGHIEVSATGGSQYNPDGTATGSIDAANGLITITAPWSDFGSQLSPAVPTPTLHSNLVHIGSASFEEVGTNSSGGLLESADSAAGTTPYLVGKNCNPAQLTFDPSSLNQGYNGTGDAVTATTTPAGLAYAVTYNGSSTVPTQPGTYAVDANITDDDYIGTASGTLTVSPATLTVTAGNAASVYGHAVPAITPTYSGFVNGETVSNLTSPATCSTSATSSSGAGSYSTLCSGASSPDYTISYTPGTLTIGRAALTVKASSGSMTYGQKRPSITPSYSGFVNGDGASSLSPAPTCGTTATSSSPAGTYVTSCSGGSAANYALTYESGSLTIGLAKPAISYSGPTSVKPGAKATLKATLTSTVNGADISGRTLTFTLGSGSTKQSCSAQTNSSGLATCAISKVNGKAGSRTLTVTFAGDQHGASYDYASATLSKTVKVS